MGENLKMIDLFSGGGGFSYAAEKLVGGYETMQFVEIDPYCQKVLKKHWPTVPIHDDIKTYKPEPYSAHVVCGGFPCQDLSCSGKRLGITKETRSGLFYELMRVVCVVRPKYVIMENVAAILNNGLGIVLGELSKAGFNAEWGTFRASDYVRAAHHRDRWFCIGINKDFTDPDSFRCRGRDSKRCSVQERQLLQGEQERGKMGSETQGCNNNTPNTNNDGLFIPEKSTGTKKSDGGSKKRKEIFVKSEGSSQPRNSRTVQQTSKWRNTKHLLNPNWKEYGVEPAICGDPNGSSSELLTNRASRLKLLGNGLVPQCATIPLQRILDLENGSRQT